MMASEDMRTAMEYRYDSFSEDSANSGEYCDTFSGQTNKDLLTNSHGVDMAIFLGTPSEDS
jgi:hypothetical protein